MRLATLANIVRLGNASYREWRIREDGATGGNVNLLYGGVLNYGASPNIAQLFLIWLATKNGGLVFEKMTRRGNSFIPNRKLRNL
jgi:hypothetical protein